MFITNLKRGLVFFGVFALLAALAGPARANSIIYHFVLPSTGWVLVPHGNGKVMMGTGWVVDQNRHWIVTNHHVVGDFRQVKVFFPIFHGEEVVTNKAYYMSKNSIPGTVLAVDRKRDLAVIQLPYLPNGIRTLPLAPHSARPGETLYSIGNSGANSGFLWTLRTAKVAEVGFGAFTLRENQNKVEAQIITSNADVHPGDSGGPVVNSLGQLVGVTSAFNPRASLSIDVSEVREFITRVLHPDWHQTLSSPILGTWTLMAQKNGKAINVGLNLRPDGTCIWITSKVQEGTFTFQDGVLHVIVPGSRINERVAITWSDADHFQFVSSNIQFQAHRR